MNARRQAGHVPVGDWCTNQMAERLRRQPDRYGWAPDLPVLKTAVGEGADRQGPSAVAVRAALGRVPTGFGGLAGGATADLVAAVRTFQRANGIPSDGRIDLFGLTHARLSQLQPSRMELMRELDRSVFGADDQVQAWLAAGRGVLAAAANALRRAVPPQFRADVPRGQSPGWLEPSPLAPAVGLVNKHFGTAAEPVAPVDVQWLAAQLERLATGYKLPADQARPWGPHVFEPDPFLDPDAYAFTTAAGRFNPPTRLGWLRSDVIYLCEALRGEPAEEKIATAVHELAHFASPAADAVLDYAYGQSYDTPMQPLCRFHRQRNAASWENFLAEAALGKEVLPMNWPVVEPPHWPVFAPPH